MVEGRMHGRMMDFPLTLTHLLERARSVLPGDRGGEPRRGRQRCTVTRGPRSTSAPRSSRTRWRRLGVKPGRSGGDARLEPPPAPRGVLRGADDGGRRPHAEPAPPPHRDRLHRAPRRGLGRPRRPVAAPALRPVRRERPEHPPRRRDAGQRADARGEGRLRAAHRARGRRVRLAAARREPGGADLLHVRHDGQPEGRRLQPPVERPARARRVPGRLARRSR